MNGSGPSAVKYMHSLLSEQPNHAQSSNELGRPPSRKAVDRASSNGRKESFIDVERRGGRSISRGRACA